jgi:hypothetical protein
MTSVADFVYLQDKVWAAEGDSGQTNATTYPR